MQKLKQLKDVYGAEIQTITQGCRMEVFRRTEAADTENFITAKYPAGR